MDLLFDLDGTITDSREGIVRCIQHALDQVNCVAPATEELIRFIGPPLADSLAKLLGTTEAALIDQAIAAYRDRFQRQGMFENRLYPGIMEALTEFSAADHNLYVVTAKPRVYAQQILNHLKVARMFRNIYGPELQHRQYTKESLIREWCVHHPRDFRKAVMIGDRGDDIIAAKRNGLNSIGVTWGYGDREELEGANPDAVITSAEELVEYFKR